MPDAPAAAKSAAERAGVVVRELTAIADVRSAATLLGALWPEPDGRPPLAHDVLVALQIGGNYVFGAFSPDGPLIGASVAWATPPAPVELHSHITGVDTRWHRSGVGLALKLHQRAWALDRGIATIIWTFDPLLRRNASFNLSRLGAEVDAYLEDVYGTMTDTVNSADESDRLLVRWRLQGEAAVRGAAGGRTRIDVDAPLLVGPGPDGLPHESTGLESLQHFAVEVPDDIESLREKDPLVRSWRAAVRRALAGTLSNGGRILGLDGAGNYVVTATPAECGEGSR